MNSKLLMILGVLCLVAAGLMFVIGSSNSRLTELKDFFWAPIPLGIGLLIWAKKCCGSCNTNNQTPPSA